MLIRLLHPARIHAYNRIMTTGKGKRPSDPNQLAKWVVDRSTAEPPKPPAGLSAYMAAIGKKGGQIGGKRRLETMSAAQRSRVAARAAAARWKKKP